MKRLTVVAALAASFVVAPVALGAPTASLTLNSHQDWNRHYTAPVFTRFTVPKRTYGVAVVSGMFSYYPAKDYLHPKAPWPIVCGTAVDSSHGPLGFDAEFILARPWTTKQCRRHDLPMTWPNFEAYTGAYPGWSHPTILGSWPSAPTSGHIYSYAIVGDGQHVGFRLWDVYTRDNYGKLHIVVRPATASDCQAFWSFGFRSRSACVAHVG